MALSVWISTNVLLDYTTVTLMPTVSTQLVGLTVCAKVDLVEMVSSATTSTNASTTIPAQPLPNVPTLKAASTASANPVSSATASSVLMSMNVPLVSIHVTMTLSAPTATVDLAANVVMASKVTD